jgi:SAM-dependent methyltransferase
MPNSAQGFPTLETIAFDHGVDLELFECSGCGVVQLASEPVPYYREVIRAAGISPVLQEEKRDQYASFITAHGLTGKRILEVGCGRGEFLTVLRSFPVEAVGLEYCKSSVEVCRKAGLKVFQGYPEDGFTLPEEPPFDAFLLQMFLEHMPKPVAALRAISCQLAPGGVGLVEVPNFDAMAVHGQFSEFIADHLLYFSRRTLSLTLEIAGFDVLNMGELRDGYVLAATVRRRHETNLSAMRISRERMTEDLRSFIAECAGGVAVWGAGHQALALIALAGIAGSVRYVIDSAPFKQGKFTPVTHLPIVSPEKLKTDPVDGVIVLAGGYSEEVSGILIREYGDRLRVAVLRGDGLEYI